MDKEQKITGNITPPKKDLEILKVPEQFGFIMQMTEEGLLHLTRILIFHGQIQK